MKELIRLFLALLDLTIIISGVVVITLIALGIMDNPGPLTIIIFILIASKYLRE